MWSGEIDIGAGETAPPVSGPEPGDGFATARLLVRDGIEPLGFVNVALDDGRLDPARVETAIRDEGFSVAPRSGQIAERPRPYISAAVCTRGRPVELERCLTALRAVTYPNCEFIIVDNAPTDDATRTAFEQTVGDDARFTYSREPAPGLSKARNHALGLARGEIIAFTDDDCQADRFWLYGVAQGFARTPRVGCVTGLVASASLRTSAEQYFDARVWWSSSCTQRLYTETPGPEDPVIHPFSAGRFGTGANMAYRRALIAELGGFDEALGAGSLTGGGEDLDAFVRVIRSGYELSYEPAALIWHEHRADNAALRRQMYTYGTGLGAYIAKYLSQRDSRGAVIARAPRALWYLVTLGSRSSSAADTASISRGVQLAELQGLLAGPWTYYRARRRSPSPRPRVNPPAVG